MYSQRRKLRRKRKLKKVIPFLAFLIVIAAFVYLVYFSGIFEIKEIIVHDGEQSKEFVDRLIADRPSYKNFVLFPRWQVRNSLKDNFPEIKGVSFSSDLKSKTLQIKVVFREPAFLVCSTFCFLADKDGFLFRKVIQEENAPSDLIKIIKEGPITIKDSLDKEMLSALSLISQNLQKLNIESPKTVIIKKNNDIEIDFEHYPILFLSPSLSFSEQFNKLEKFLTNEELRKNFDLTKLEYIDLRIHEKVFVK